MFGVAVKVLALSEYTTPGIPNLLENLMKDKIKSLRDILGKTSRWMARVVKQENIRIYLLVRSPLESKR